MLNAIGDNTNVASILKLLLENSSLKNQYHYRNKEIGQLMLSLMNNSSSIAEK